MHPSRITVVLAALIALLSTTGLARAADRVMEEQLLQRLDQVRLGLDDDARRGDEMTNESFDVAVKVAELYDAFAGGADPGAVLAGLAEAKETLGAIAYRHETVAGEVRTREGTLSAIRSRGVQIRSRTVVDAVDATMPQLERIKHQMKTLSSRIDAVDLAIRRLETLILGG